MRNRIQIVSIPAGPALTGAVFQPIGGNRLRGKYARR